MATYPDSLLILNGKSAGNDLLRQAITELREDGACIHVRVTFEKGDAARYIDEGIRLGVQTIISGGGDGTINEIAGALIDLNAAARPAMGIYRSVPPTILPPAPVFRRMWEKRYSWPFSVRLPPSILLR